MPIIADYHMHTAYSADSDTEMELQIQSAIEKGLKIVCFTDHLDFDTPYEAVPEAERLEFSLDHVSRRKEFLELKEKYKDRIELHYGLEMGMNTRLEQETNKYIEEHPEYEFIIGSIHSDHENDPYYAEFFEGITAQQAVTSWFENTLRNVRTYTFFNTLGHLDYIERNSILYEEEELLQSLKDQGISYGTYCYEQNREVVDEILKELISTGRMLEINSAAIFRSLGKDGLKVHREQNPCTAILKRYYELGGRNITIGADAHVPAGVAGSFDRAEEEARKAGFAGYWVFREREGEFIPFE